MITTYAFDADDTNFFKNYGHAMLAGMLTDKTFTEPMGTPPPMVERGGMSQEFVDWIAIDYENHKNMAVAVIVEIAKAFNTPCKAMGVMISAYTSIPIDVARSIGKCELISRGAYENLLNAFSNRLQLSPSPETWDLVNQVAEMDTSVPNTEEWANILVNDIATAQD